MFESVSVTFWTGLLQIIWIDLLLSGDNAIIIALACRSLPKHQIKMGIILGAGAAIGLRILFAFIVSYLYLIPYLKTFAGLLLLWIAVKLLQGNHEEHGEVESSDNLWGAVRTIAVADAVMSLDNVIAITGAAGEHRILFVFGLLLTIPLIVFGSTLFLTLIQRFPVIVWAGGALLGWIAGGMIAGDTAILAHLGDGWIEAGKQGGGIHPVSQLHYGLSIVGALLAMGIGFLVKKKTDAKTG